MATFLEVSKLVTGFTDIGGDIETVYFEIMSSKSDWIAELDKLMVAADEALASADPEAKLTVAMEQSAEVRNAVRRLAHLWYAGRLPTVQGGADPGFISEEAYFSGLLWRAARAHPPGLSGGYTGHWRYAPDG